MADIVELNAVSRSRAVDAREPAGSAEIIIFPGVRIERWEQQPEQKPQARAKRARDRLELPD